MVRFVQAVLAIIGLAGIGVVFYAWEIKDPRDWGLAFGALAITLVLTVIVWVLKAFPRPKPTTTISIPEKYSGSLPSSAKRTSRSTIDFTVVESPRHAYETGKKDLKQNDYLGAAPAGPSFALVMGVSLTRCGGDPAKFQPPPSYGELSKPEKDAVSLIYTGLFGSARDVNEIISSIHGAKLFEPVFMLFQEAEKYWGLKSADPDASILQRIIEENRQPVQVFKKTEFNGAGMIVPYAMQIVEIMVEEGGMPSVEERKANRRELNSTGPVTLLRAPRLNGVSWEEARCWFGGLPRLGNQAWPRTRKTKTPMAFLTQIDLAHFREIGGSDLLPADGWLAFFLDGDGRECSVLHIEGADLPARTTPPSEAMRNWHWFGRHGVATDFLYGPPSKFELPYFPIELVMAGYQFDSDLRSVPLGLENIGPVREVGLSAKNVNEAAGVDTVFFGHTVQHFAARMKIAAENTGQNIERIGKRVDQNKLEEIKKAEPNFTAVCRELYSWSEKLPRWSILTWEELDRFKLFVSSVYADDFDAFIYGNHFRGYEDLLTPTYLAMLASPDDVFVKLPATVQTILSENFRTPGRLRLHQMFGVGIDIQEGASIEHANDHMLLQLCYDDIMGWRFGDVGVFQFWISPKNLKKRRWDKVSVTFEGH